jgi:5-methyltetrahydrofolate--homocysteine methyltransferase
MDEIMTAKREGRAVAVAEPRRARPRHTTVAEAPARRSDVRIDVPVPEPPFWGSRVVKGIGVPEIARYLNKTTLFRKQWQYVRKRSQTPEEYREFLDAKVEPILRTLLDRCIAEQILVPAVVYGYFPVQSRGNDLIVYRPGTSDEWVRFTFPRQARDRHLCLSDFFRPVEGGEMDVVAFHLVTMGRRVSEETKRLFDADQYTDYLYLHGLGVEMAEALAELWHRRVREELGIAADDASEVEGLFDSKYRGARYSFGYPAAPNLEDQQQIFELLEPERIDVALSEEFQLDPEQSTSAIIVHHPEARYFSVGRAALKP